jgi:hypothetical protein
VDDAAAGHRCRHGRAARTGRVSHRTARESPEHRKMSFSIEGPRSASLYDGSMRGESLRHGTAAKTSMLYEAWGR